MWIGQESTPPVELVNYGALGIVVVSLLFGWLWPRSAVDRLLQDKDRLIAERDNLLAEQGARIAEQGARIGELGAEVRKLRGEVRELRRASIRDP